jgi:hypothetical protein
MKQVHVLFFLFFSGKTLLLFLQGLRWLREGHHVCVFNTTRSSLPHAFTTQIAHQLRATMARSSKEPPAVSLHCYDLETPVEVDKAVKELTKMAENQGKQLYILMDEGHFDQKKVTKIANN